MVSGGPKAFVLCAAGLLLFGCAERPRQITSREKRPPVPGPDRRPEARPEIGPDEGTLRAPSGALRQAQGAVPSASRGGADSRPGVAGRARASGAAPGEGAPSRSEETGRGGKVARTAERVRNDPVGEGFGAQAKGGFGGKVISVSNLDAGGPGSLQEALNTKGPRIIRFDVAGTIRLRRKPLSLGGPFAWEYQKAIKAGRTAPGSPYSYVTVDGASAPPPGITISGRMKLTGGVSHVVLRHLRIRQNGYVRRDLADCLSVLDGCRHILVDHCSFTWGRDESVNLWGDCADISLQWCIVTGYGPHGYGFLSGHGADRITLHHNLLAHNVWRNPLVAGDRPRGLAPLVDFRGNVVYDWEGGGATHVWPDARANVVGNVYEYGPSSSPRTGCVTVREGARCYAENNVAGGRKGRPPVEPAEVHCAGERTKHPFDSPPVGLQPHDDLRMLVLSLAGATPRDPIDAGVVRTVLGRSGWAGMKNTVPEDYTNAPPEASFTARGEGLEVDLSARTSDADGRIVSCTWDFGDGGYAVGQRAEHTYPGSGNYTVTLHAMDDMGMTGSAMAELTVARRLGAPSAGRTGAVSVARQAQAEAVAFRPISAQPIPHAPRPVPAAGEPPVVIRVPRTAGQVDEGDWNRAVRLSPFIRQDDWKPVPGDEIDARLLHDSRCLYLKITSTDPHPDRIRPVRKSGRERPWKVEKGLCMELYFSPQWGKEPWFQFIVNTDGQLYDAKGFDRNWDPPTGWTVRSRAEGNKWVLEVAVPFASFGRDAVTRGRDNGSVRTSRQGTACGLKLCRYRDEDDIFLWPTLGPCEGSRYSAAYSHEPVEYAQLVLEDDAARKGGGARSPRLRAAKPTEVSPRSTRVAASAE